MECLAKNCISRQTECSKVCQWWTYELTVMKARGVVKQ
jgi:hypothetical protein